MIARKPVAMSQTIQSKLRESALSVEQNESKASCGTASSTVSMGAGLGSLCVGREAELARARSLYERSTREGGLCLVVSGPSGVGKSRLLQEFKRRCRLDGVCVLEGRCRQDRRAYQPFLEIVREASSYLADLAPHIFGAARTMEILEALEGQSADTSNLRFDRWEDRRAALFESVGELLRSVARVRPPVVILHDLQLGDAGTLSLLGHLLSTLSGSQALRSRREDSRFQGLFVFSERSNGERSQATQRLLTGVSHALLELDVLDRAGVEAFLSAPGVVNRFIEVTGGNPRQIEALIEHSRVDADGLFRERIEGLPASARTMVQVLAVLGRPASPRTLGAIAGLKGSALAEATERLLKGDVLVSSIQEGDLKFAFKSSSDQDVALSGLAPALFASLHQRAGEELLRRGDDVCAAEHLLLGTGGADTADVVLRAGERLEVAFAYERAIDLYERAIEHAPPRALAQELEDRLCDLLELTGEYERAVCLTGRLIERNPADPTLVRRLGQLHLQQGDFTAAMERLQLALEMQGGGCEWKAERALVLCDLAELAYLQGDHHAARSRAAEVLIATDESPEPAIKARNTLGKVCLERGEFSVAAELFGENLRASRDKRLLREETRALINQGITHLRMGSYEDAAACYRTGLAAAESSADFRHRAFCLQNLGVLAHWRRDYTSALQLFHDAIQTFLKLGHKSWLSWLALDLGDLYLELGDAVRAQSMLELSETLVDAKDDSQTPLFADMLKGKLAAFDGRFEDAEGILRSVLERAMSAEKIDEMATTSLELARLFLQTGRPSEAETLALQWLDAPTVKTRAAAQAILVEAGLESGAAHEDLDRTIGSALALFERLGDAFGLWSLLARRAEVARVASRSRDCEAALLEARRIEARVRKSVPEEFVDGYLNHPQRAGLLTAIGAAAPTPRPAAAELPTQAESTPPSHVVASGIAAARVRPPRHDKRHPAILGENEDLLRMLDLIDKIAPIDSTVLIRGESGTGKELVAEALHQHSRRAGQPFVKVNCGALVESLLLSELFGHERGAFTGALRRKPGRFELADGGTIFLDEIGDITPNTQVALLRVLQEKQFERVGGTTPIRVNVRIVCATHRDLEKMVREGSFREDLYYRLKAFQIEVPPLRLRGNDVLILARRFLEDLVTASECPPRRLGHDAENLLVRWSWPGNVRELQNVIRSVSLLADGEVVHRADLLPFMPDSKADLPSSPLLSMSSSQPSAQPEVPLDSAAPAMHGTPEEDKDPYEKLLSEGLSLHEYKKRIEEACISKALRQTNGNITRAAELLGMKRPRLSQLVKEYGLSSQAGKD
ncbi:MAG: sigma 54-interacting transcriptional regulator [Polyangia bacterium]|jgi:DNA-binding NtrC family response regulator/tetratricopeptide (TPR) repeat protein|nr:sigma 54-interacting transcriptional regulator [Polyangia bacterium]